MNCFFFTYVDDNPKYRRDAEILIKSGKKFGRDIHLYEIPGGAMWNRYKVELLAGELPEADRYICLDSDTVMTCHGDWEADDCQGVMDILYYMDEPNRHKYTYSFIKNHTLLDGDRGAHDFIYDLWQRLDFPIWPNSGVVVLDADVRLHFARCWKKWMKIIDSHADAGFVVGDEAPCTFARHTFDLPLLPPRFNGCCKWQEIHDWHVLLHADGNVTGEKRRPFDDAVARVLSDEYEK